METEEQKIIDEISTFEQAREVYNLAPSKSELRKKAKGKMVELKPHFTRFILRIQEAENETYKRTNTGEVALDSGI